MCILGLAQATGPLSLFENLRRDRRSGSLVAAMRLKDGLALNGMMAKIPQKASMAVDLRNAPEFVAALRPSRHTTILPRDIDTADYAIRHEALIPLSDQERRMVWQETLVDEELDRKYFAEHGEMWLEVFSYTRGPRERISLWQRSADR